jgi:rare lipoprotein A
VSVRLTVSRSLEWGLIIGCLTWACARETPRALWPAPDPPPPVTAPTAREPHAPPQQQATPTLGQDGQRLFDRYATSPALARFSGEASYYSDKLAGRSTASGEPYDPRAFTAAHRSLPFGTVVRVVRSEPPGVVYVRINDRGPFRKGRVIDLSRAAAEALEMMRAGVIPIRAEIVEYGPPPRKKRAPARQKKRR